MEEIPLNQNNNDLNKFKEEVLSHIRELENKLTNQITNKESKLNKDYKEFTDKMNTLIKNNKNMVSDLVSQKLKIEKIGELETFKNKVDGMLITHEVRIKNTIDDIEKIKTKYDKIITDNLYVSGFIGNSCQFKNLSEYLSYNISEVSKIKLERDQFKRDLKELKNKIDGLMKNILTLNDNSVKLCNKYTDSKQEEISKLFNVTEQELNRKNMEMRAMTVQFKADIEKNSNDLKNEFNKLLQMKDEFNDYINEKYQSSETKHDELNQKTINNYQDIENNKNKLESFNDEIKKLDKNIKDLAFQVRNYYCVNNKLAELLEKLGANPSKSEIAKLIFGSQNNIINSDNKKGLPNSPQPKRRINKNMNIDLLQFELDDSKSFRNNNNIKNDISSPQKKNKVNIIGLKRLNNKDFNNNNLDSESSIMDESIKNNKNNNNAKQPTNNTCLNKKKSNIIENNNTQTNIKENSQENNNNKRQNTFNKTNTATKEKSRNKDDINIKDKLNENISNTPRTLLSSSKQTKQNFIKGNHIKYPLLTLGNKEENNLEEIKTINLDTSIIRNNSDNNKNKKNLIMVINNGNIKDKKNIKKTSLDLKQNKKECKIVSLSLPENLFFEPVISVIKKKNGNEKRKNDMVNSLINEYRAKLFTKANSPEAKFELNNEILDIPKKVTQAFGRTTYMFYFKKDAIDCANAKNNINNFGYNGPKKKYKFLNNKKIDTGGYKSTK